MVAKAAKPCLIMAFWENRMTKSLAWLIPLRGDGHLPDRARDRFPGWDDAMDGDQSRDADFAGRLRSHQVQIFSFIYSLVRNFEDADDLFQQTSLAMWNKYDQYDPSRSFAAWACGVARFEVSNFIRARGRQRLYFSDDLSLLLADAQESLEQDRVEERREALAECMKKLRKSDQQLVESCYGEESRVPEVAREWGRSSQSIHNSLRRIRRSLFECVRRSLAPGGLST
jgi:RNA polymerase sigma-70 factor, ECF subfamily